MVESKTSPTKLYIYANTIHNGMGYYFPFYWLFHGVLLMVYNDPYITGKYDPLPIYTKQPSVFSLLIWLFSKPIASRGLVYLPTIRRLWYQYLKIPCMDPVGIYKSKRIQHLLKVLSGSLFPRREKIFTCCLEYGRFSPIVGKFATHECHEKLGYLKGTCP